MEVGQKAVVIKQCCSDVEIGTVVTCDWISSIDSVRFGEGNWMCRRDYLTIGDRVRGDSSGRNGKVINIDESSLPIVIEWGNDYIQSFHPSTMLITKIQGEEKEEREGKGTTITGEEILQTIYDEYSTFKCQFQKEENMSSESRAQRAKDIEEITIPDLEGEVQDINAQIADLKDEVKRLREYASDQQEKDALMEKLLGKDKAKTVKALQKAGVVINITA